jgi:hypothetical protein
MKYVASLIALVLFGAALPASAGSFGGPAPFRNGSPLATGTDGLYNASLRGTNLSGVFRFSISKGSQNLLDPDPISNTWVAFYQGNIIRGNTDAAIIENKVSGTLDPLIPRPDQGIQPGIPGLAVQSPGAFLLQGGFFTGSLNQKSPIGSMKGSGQFVVNDLNNNSRTVKRANPPFIGDSTTYHGLSTIDFTWRGARVR